MANSLTDWVGDAHELTAPKPLQMAKALRRRKAAVQNAPRNALAGEGNVFQRHAQGIDAVEAAASK
jgi:hypothetical protein